MIAKVLDIYATIYTISSATKCRSCVKLIDEDSGSLFVFALARDEMSARENRHDDERRHRTRHDKLDDNSDFVSLFDPDTGDDGFFFADDVSKLKGYKSTSYSYRINVRSDPNQQPENDVPVLPYKSVLVWPIRQDKDESIGADTMRCVGFLAIDSEAPRAFQRRWDAPLGKILANSLYPVLERYALIDRMLTNAEPSGALQVPAVPATGLIGHERG